MVLLALLPALWVAACGGDRPRIENGDPAPRFVLRDLSGREVRLDDFRGETVALRFWADWCPYCTGEMKALEPIQRRLRPRGVVLLAINVGQSREVAARFAERLGISYPVLLDRDSAVSRRYGVMALPTTVFIDGQGRVRGKILGESAAEEFEALALGVAGEKRGGSETGPL